MKQLITLLMIFFAVSCDKVDDMSLNGQVFTQRYPIKNCADHMKFNKNTVTITYADCRLYKGYWDIKSSEHTYNYTYKNGILKIDGLEVLSISIGNPDKIIIKRGNEVGYVEFHRIN